MIVTAALLLIGADVAAARSDDEDELADKAETAAWRASAVGPTHLTPDEVMFLVDYESYQSTQQAGLGLFGGGFGVAVVGIVLTVIDPYGALGLAGFITVGGGVVTMSSGMFVLGISRAAWQESLREEYSDLLTSRSVSYTFFF
jgi:hypothetical protein